MSFRKLLLVGAALALATTTSTTAASADTTIDPAVSVTAGVPLVLLPDVIADGTFRPLISAYASGKAFAGAQQGTSDPMATVAWACEVTSTGPYRVEFDECSVAMNSGASADSAPVIYPSPVAAHPATRSLKGRFISEVCMSARVVAITAPAGTPGIATGRRCYPGYVVEV